MAMLVIATRCINRALSWFSAQRLQSVFCIIIVLENSNILLFETFSQNVNLAVLSAFLLCSKRDAKYLMSISFCLFICLSARITQKPPGQTLPNFLCLLLMVIALSSSDSVEVCCVLPILFRSSRFHIMALWCIMW